MVDLVSETEADDKREPPASLFGWTSSRATRMYYIHHAPVEKLLEYVGLDPLPDAPPPNLAGPSEP